MFLISKKGPHTSIGNDAPRELKKAIEKYFAVILKIAIEPKLLCDQGNKDLAMSSYVERKDESTYIYRRKAFDLMTCLNDLLCRVDVCLATKHGQTVKEHFMDLQKPPYAPFLDCKELCERVVEKYEHARYSCRGFDLSDYEILATDMDALTKKVYSRLPVPGSLLLPSSKVEQSQSQTSSVFDRHSQGLINSESIRNPEIVLGNIDINFPMA